MARPPKGEDLIDKYEGSPSAKERLRIILQTIAGKKRVLEACEELGVSKTRFHEVRSEALLGALSSLEPSPVGRPPKEEEEALPSDVEALKAEVKRLKKEVIISRVQAVLEVAPPELMEPQEPVKKKKKRRKKRKKKK